MKLSIIGLGPGNLEMVTNKAMQVLEEADLIIGAERLLKSLPRGCTSNRVAAVKTEAIIEILQCHESVNPCVVFSGDIGCYSGAKRLLELWKGEAELLPGVGSVTCLSASIGEPWQDWHIVSAHGRACNPVAELCCAQKVFFLTGGENGPGELCHRLTEAGMGDLPAVVGEMLAYPEEQILTGTVQEFAQKSFAAMSVLLVRRKHPIIPRCPGLPDEVFVRGKVPMTKQEVRAVALAKLGIQETEIVYDIGAGTGAMSVELALAARKGHVYAAECNSQACTLILENRKKGEAYNLTVLEGMAPDVLKQLPAPDAAFIGGTKGNLREIIKLLKAKNPMVRIVISAITMETLSAAVEEWKAIGLGEPEVTQIAVSKTTKIEDYHMFQAQNPVFLISGGGACVE